MILNCVLLLSSRSDKVSIHPKLYLNFKLSKSVVVPSALKSKIIIIITWVCEMELT